MRRIPNMTKEEMLEHLAAMLNKRGYIVVACLRPRSHGVGDIIPNLYVHYRRTNQPCHVLSETDWADMCAQWPDDLSICGQDLTPYYRFYRVSLD